MEWTSERQQKFAGFWIRLVASIIDALILSLVDLLPLYILGPTLDLFISLIIGSAYSICFWVWQNGQTPGKMLLRIRVIRTDGSPLTWRNAILRYLGYFVSAFFLLMGFLWIAFDARKQGWHDKIAETYVIIVR